MHRALRLALEALVLVLAAWQIADVGGAMWQRLGANFDLEWMEGATLITGLRAAEGLPFYTAPQPDYIPFIYPPLYAWTLGALSHVFPLGYALGRGLSIACTVGAAAILAIAARREGARWPFALGVAALFLGCYEEGGTFYDLVRIDSFALLFTGAALLLGRGASRGAAVASGLLLAVAFAAKHNMALFGLPIVLWRWRTFGWRDALTFVAASAGPALAFTIALQVRTGGLFLTYLLGVPGEHGMVADRALPNLKQGRVEGAQAELVRALPVVATVGVLSIVSWARTRAGAYWGGLLLTGLVMVSLMRGHQGGYLNVLIPMFWLMPLVLVLAERSLAGAGGAGRGGTESGGTGWRRFVPLAFTGLLAIQLWEGRSDLRRYVPTRTTVENAAALVEELRGLPGPVLMPHGPWYPVMAGHPPSFALIALWDVDHKGGPLEKQSHVVDRAIANGRWKTVVTPDDKLGHGLMEHYERAGRLTARPFRTHTGWPIQFRQIWRPKEGNTEGKAPADASSDDDDAAASPAPGDTRAPDPGDGSAD